MGVPVVGYLAIIHLSPILLQVLPTKDYVAVMLTLLYIGNMQSNQMQEHSSFFVRMTQTTGILLSSAGMWIFLCAVWHSTKNTMRDTLCWGSIQPLSASAGKCIEFVYYLCTMSQSRRPQNITLIFSL